jgi:hypothetical protein
MTTVMNQSDEELQARFDASSAEARAHFLDLYEGWRQLPFERRVSWTPMKEVGPNTYSTPYPTYSAEYEAMVGALERLGVYAPHDWMDRKTEYRTDDTAAIAALPIPELARLIFRLRRAERFSEGSQSSFIEHGGFDALLENVAGRLR